MPVIPFKFTYLLGSSLFFVYWLFIYFNLKEFRSRLIFFSLLYAIIGVTFGFLYTVDWWRPETVFGSRVGIEDFILGFTNGGIAATGYLLFFKVKGEGEGKVARILAPLLLTAVVTFFLFIVLGLNSFYANSLGILAAIIYILIQRRDLLSISILSGIAMVFLSLPIYLIMIFLSPGWVETAWTLENLSGILALGIPVEDYIWYFLVGAFISILYPYFKKEYYENKCQ